MASIPSDLAFGKALSSVNIRRLPVRQGTDTQSYTTNSKIQIQLPADFADLRQSYLSFFAQAPINGGTYVRFSYGIGTIFSRCQIFCGSTIIEDIDDYAVLNGIFKEASSYSSVNNTGMEGYYLAATRATQTNAGRQYQLKLRLESLQQVWPLHKLKLPMRIVLTVADGLTFLEYDGAAPTVTINNMYLNYHLIQPDPAVDALIDSQIASGNLKIHYRTWDNYNVQVGTATSNTLLLPFKRKCVNALLAVWRDTGDVNSPAVNGKFVDQFQSKSVIGGFVKILNLLYPQDKYDFNFNQGFMTLSQVFNQVMQPYFYAHERQQDTFSLQDIDNRVVAAFDLRRDSSPNSANLWDNGVDTSASANSQSMNFIYSALTGALQYDVFALYESTVTILPNGNILLDN